MSTTGLQIHQMNNIRYYDIYFYGTWQITGALRCFNMQLITHTPSSICTLSATESHLTIINDWIRQKLWAATSSSSSNTGCVCFRLTAPRRRLHSGEWGGLWVVYHVVFLVKLIRGTYTHGERLGSLLDDKAFDDMCEDLGFDDGLGRFVLSVLRRAARHGGRLVLISWGHGWRWGPRCSARPLGCAPSWSEKQNEYNTSQLIQKSMWEPVTSRVSLNDIRAERKEVINHSCHVSGEEWQTFSCYIVLNEDVMVVSCQMLWYIEYLWILACGSDLKKPPGNGLWMRQVYFIVPIRHKYSKCFTETQKCTKMFQFCDILEAKESIN